MKSALIGESMPSSERRDKVLGFLATHDMALPPTAIYAGLKRHEDITFGYRTVQNALSDLLDQGLVKRVNTNRLREDGQIEEIVGDDTRRAYYSITEAGRDRLEDNNL